MGGTKVLVVEDDAAIRRALVDALRHTGYTPVEAADGLSAAGRAEGVDLVLLDLVLPGRDGLDVLRDLRRADPTLPVILVTALGEESQRVAGLELGADDYVVKPFSVRELLARVEAVLRRSPERPRPVQRLRLPAGTVDLERLEVVADGGGTASLTHLEGRLLGYLAGQATRVVSRDELIHRVWEGRAHFIATRSVDMTVARLRKKIAVAGGVGLLETVRGEGYRLHLSATEAGPGDTGQAEPMSRKPS